MMTYREMNMKHSLYKFTDFPLMISTLFYRVNGEHA